MNFQRIKNVLIEEETQILGQALNQISENISYKLYIVQEAAYAINKNNKFINKLIDVEPQNEGEIVKFYLEEVLPIMSSYSIGIYFTPKISIYIDKDSIIFDGE